LLREPDAPLNIGEAHIGADGIEISGSILGTGATWIAPARLLQGGTPLPLFTKTNVDYSKLMMGNTPFFALVSSWVRIFSAFLA
jgi:hypothetical protein